MDSLTEKFARLAAAGDEGDELVEPRRGQMDVPFLLLVLLILCVGLVMVFSASFAASYYENSGNSTYYIGRQAMFAVMGLAFMAVASRVPVKLFRWASLPLLAASIVLLILVPIIGVGTEEDGSLVKRWIDLGFTTFQPSEVAKLGVIMSFSLLIATFKDKMRTFKYGILPFGAILITIAGLLMLEPHISATIIIVGVGAALMFLGGIRLYWVAIGAIGVGGAAYLVFNVFSYAASRIAVWRDPFNEEYRLGAAWQTLQSLYSVGSGGLLGLGLGKSRQKFLYLPEEHNDFIFSIVCEELGYVGALLVLLLFAMLIIRGYWIALHARDRYSMLLVAGITTLLALQVFLNVAVVTNLLPCTGVSLPFFSYGGTALLIQLVEVGMILSVSREINVKKAG